MTSRKDTSIVSPPPVPSHVLRRLDAEKWERKRQQARAADAWISEHEPIEQKGGLEMSGCLCGLDLSRVLSSLQTLIDQADRVATSAPSESMRVQGAAEMVGLVKARYLLELEQLRAKRSRDLGGD